MPKPSRKRRILKWAGLVACAPLVLAIVLTQLWSFGWSGMQYSTELTNSAFLVTLYRFDIPFDGVGPSLQETGTVSFIWWYQSIVVQSGIAVYIVPLWMPLALIGIPTILAWRRDRRIPPGHCRKCRYDLTGNESGVCPECGTDLENA